MGMSHRSRWSGWYVGFAALSAFMLIAFGCKAISNRLTKWHMLGSEALENPLQAVGGDGIVFTPREGGDGWTRQRLAMATPAELVTYYAPIFLQQRVDTSKLGHPYPQEYDQIGEARLRREGAGFKAFVAGPPKVYAIFEKRRIGGNEHIQLTYTAWYPAHPRMKALDWEEADIDSCVVRATLALDNTPLFYETIMACGCYHKVFVEKWLDESALLAYGPPEKGKKYAIERTISSSIDWEVAGLMDEPRDGPKRPVVFLKAGDHKVLGMHSTARLRVPPNADRRPYELVSYSELYSLPVDGTTERGPFFDMGKGGKVWGAERKERFLFSLIGVDDAGQPRANDQIKLHFDQSTWGDPTAYERYLRLPQGTL